MLQVLQTLILFNQSIDNVCHLENEPKTGTFVSVAPPRLLLLGAKSQVEGSFGMHKFELTQKYINILDF